MLRTILGAFDEETLDREWVVRNLIGGMVAGFGLRGKPLVFDLTRPFRMNMNQHHPLSVILDCPPIITTLVVIFGWAIKTGVAYLVNGWVNSDQEANQRWVVYSIP